MSESEKINFTVITKALLVISFSSHIIIYIKTNILAMPSIILLKCTLIAVQEKYEQQLLAQYKFKKQIESIIY